MSTSLRDSDPVADLIASATSGESAAGAESAIDAITAARDPEETPAVEIEPTPEVEVEAHVETYTAPVQGPSGKRLTKAELQAMVEQLAAQNKAQAERLRVLEAQTSVNAINNLGATIAMAIKIGGKFMAAKRGPHWRFEKNEADGLGEAWAEVAAPYAEQIKGAIPWALAIGITWDAISKRLEQDGVLAPDIEDNGAG